MVVTTVRRKLQNLDLRVMESNMLHNSGCGPFRSGAVILRLEMVSALDLPQDAVFLLFFFEEAPQVESQVGSLSESRSEEEVWPCA